MECTEASPSRVLQESPVQPWAAARALEPARTVPFPVVAHTQARSASVPESRMKALEPLEPASGPAVA